MFNILILLAINIFVAWKYTDINIEPDWAMFNLQGIVGSKYGKDFADCKSPLVHYWMALLAKIKQSIQFVRFAHFFVTGSFSIAYFIISNDFAGALCFLVMIHSGWLFTFHGNVGDIPAGLILLALFVPNFWLKALFFALAVLYEPKLIIAYIPWAVFNAIWIPSVVYGIIGSLGLLAIWYFKHDYFDWLVEANITLAKRIAKGRKGRYGYMPQCTAIGFIYTLPWVAVAVMAKPDPLYWIPPLMYMVLAFSGRIVRNNHFIPIIPWIAMAGIDPVYVYILSGIDFMSAGLYLGDIWARFYPGLRNIIEDSRGVGEFLKDKAGTLWVNAIHTEIYLWANKKVLYGMTEQIEIAQVVPERRQHMIEMYKKDPADWVVENRASPSVRFDKAGYNMVGKSAFFNLYKRKDNDNSS